MNNSLSSLTVALAATLLADVLTSSGPASSSNLRLSWMPDSKAPGQAIEVWDQGDSNQGFGLKHGWLGPALSGGLLFGSTVVAAAIAEHRATEADMRLCDSRYRTFDWTTGTYLDRSGRIRVCPFLY